MLIEQKAARLHKTVGIKPQSSGLQVATPNDSYSPNKYLTQAPFNAAPFAVRLTAAPRTGNAILSWQPHVMKPHKDPRCRASQQSLLVQFHSSTPNWSLHLLRRFPNCALRHISKYRFPFNLCVLCFHTATELTLYTHIYR